MGEGAGRDPVAAAAWCRLAEPGDPVAGALVRLLGPGAALAWARRATRGPDEASRAAAELVAEHATGDATAHATGRATVHAVGHATEDATEDATVHATGHEVEHEAGHAVEHDGLGVTAARLTRAVARWAPRAGSLDPERDLRALARLGGTLVVPGDAGWPAGLDDLGDGRPHALWVRGDATLAARLDRSVALVGARACTGYGEHVAAEFGHGLGTRGFVVVSGGAYGIDAAAHRGALASGAPTVAFLAGGVDRLYPAGNADLLRAAIDQGAVVGELPPGSVPTRVRFLLRNRLIAAASRATVVVEAAWRSGALSTATHAAAVLRPVGAVPGPVTSMASSGCHRLLREGAAVCVTDADEAAELAGPLVVPPADAPRDSADPRPTDALDAVGRRLFDAVPRRRPATVGEIARDAGLALDETLGGLGLLELAGFAERSADGWRRVP